MPNHHAMRRLAVIVAALLLLGGAPAGAGDRAPRELVLRGDRSASVDVTLRRPVRLTCCRPVEQTVDGQASFRVAGLSVETEGTYAGFAIERVRDGRMMRGAVRIPSMDLEEGRIPTYVSFGRKPRLRPGRYRIHLLTDGPSVVRVEGAGLTRSLELAPAGPTKVAAELVTLATTTGLEQAQARVPVEVTKGATVLLAVKTEGDYAQAHYLGQCIVQPGAQCSEEEHYDTWASPASGGGGGTKLDMFERGAIEPGSYEAVFVAGSIGAPQGAYGFVLVLG